MDPQETLSELLDVLAKRDWDRVRELSDALLTWMEKGGFPPVTIGPQSLGKRWHRTITTFICHAAVSCANDAEKRRRRRRGES